MLPDSEVSVCTLLPDVLGTYSDGGNARVLCSRLRWRGIPARQVTCTVDQQPPTSCDIYLLGGGEDTSQLFATEWLRQRPQLCNTLADRSLTLAVCAGMQILGVSMADVHGREHVGVGLLNITTTPRRRRATGEVVSRSAEVGLLTGFENHRGATELGDDVRPLAHVLSGVGNGDGRFGRRATDGVRTDHIIATYMHGPVLARNPALADHILASVTGSSLTEIDLPDQRALRESYLAGSASQTMRGGKRG